MKILRVFLGDSDADSLVKHLLEDWSINNSDVTLEYQSIHSNPRAVVRLGITDLPALVHQDEIIAQGSLEGWVLSLIGHIFAPHHNERSTIIDHV